MEVDVKKEKDGGGEEEGEGGSRWAFFVLFCFDFDVNWVGQKRKKRLFFF